MMKKFLSAVLSLALCLSPMTAAPICTMAAGEESTSVSEEAVRCSITFEDEFVIKAGETKKFNYTYTGTDKIFFENQVYGTGLVLSNEYENGKGVLTVTAQEWASDVHKFWCYLGDYIEDENGSGHYEGSYLVVLNVLFHCPDCGRYVEEDEVIHGPMRSICKYCYGEGGYVGTTTGIFTTTTETTTTSPLESTTSYIRSTPVGGISADSVPDEVTIHSGETMKLNFSGMYIVGVKAVSSNENVVKAEAVLDDSSSVSMSTGNIELTACNTEMTINAEVEFFYDTFVPQDGGSKIIKVTVLGENDEPGTTDQSFVKELYADFPAGEKNGIFLRCYLAQNITFTSDCEYLRFERTGYNEPGRVQYSEAPNIIVIEENYVNTPCSQTMFVYVDENAPTGKATVNMSYTSLATGNEVEKSFDINILSKEDAALTITTTLPYTTTTTTTTAITLSDPEPYLLFKGELYIPQGKSKLVRFATQDTVFNSVEIVGENADDLEIIEAYSTEAVGINNVTCHIRCSEDAELGLHYLIISHTPYDSKDTLSVKVPIRVVNEPYPTYPADSGSAGDANCDGQLNMADAVLIMQCISNPDKYKLTEQGEKNADVDGSGDISNKDALTIQQFKLHLIESFKQ